MKLFISPGSCSLSPHIALREAELPFELEKVDLRVKRTEHDQDYREINPKGYVPALLLDDGQLLTENAVIIQYIADQKPAKHLAPANGTMDRYRLQEWLGFIGGELHKSGFGPMFNPKATDEWKQVLKEGLAKRFDYLNEKLAAHNFLLGDNFTVADSYLFTIVRWSERMKIDLTPWPNLKAHFERIWARPAVQAALKAEGLIQ